MRDLLGKIRQWRASFESNILSRYITSPLAEMNVAGLFTTMKCDALIHALTNTVTSKRTPLFQMTFKTIPPVRSAAQMQEPMKMPAKIRPGPRLGCGL